MRVLVITLMIFWSRVTIGTCDPYHLQGISMAPHHSLFRSPSVASGSSTSSSSLSSQQQHKIPLTWKDISPLFTALSADYDIAKRAEKYDMDMGRRSFTYTAGAPGSKRLPIYNFGLGKRSRPYSFGLGKRSDEEEMIDEEIDEEPQIMFNVPWSGVHQAFDAADAKRARPYSFGLGKRQPLMVNDDSVDQVERRGSSQRYNFGLGR